MSKKAKGVIAIFLFSFIGGGITPFAIKTGLKTIPPLIFLEARFILSCLIFIPILLKFRNEVEHKNYPKVFLISSLGAAFNATLFAFGIRSTTATAAATIYNLQPLAVVLFGFFILKERIDKQKILGLVIGLAGTLLIILKSLQNDPALITSVGTFKGNSLILLAMLCWSLYLILSKKFSNEFSAIVLTASTMVSAAVLVFFPALIEFFENQNFARELTRESLVALVITVISAASFFYLFQYGTKRLSAISVSLISLLSPLHAALVGTLFFGEKITLTLMSGGVLIIAGAFLSLRRNSDIKKVGRERFTQGKNLPA